MCIRDSSDRNDPRYSEIEGRDGTNGGATLMFSPNQNQTLELGWQGGHEDRQYQDVSSSGTGYTNTYQLTRSHAWAKWKGNFKPLSVQLQTYRSAIDIENSRSNGVTPTRPQYLRDQVVDGLMQCCLLYTSQSGCHRH